MKRTLSLLLFIACFYSSHSQKLMKIAYVKAGTIVSNPKEAEWMIVIRNVNGQYQRNDYKMNGRLKRVKTFKDLNQTILEGNYLEYDDNGNLLIAGRYQSNQKSGRWHYYSDSGKVLKSEKFAGLAALDDSSKYFKKNPGDSMIFPSFKKSRADWKSYMRENIDWEQISAVVKDEEVKVSFSITKTGEIDNIILLKSAGFIFDNQVIKMLMNAPKWQPATFAGEPIDYNYRQTITLLDAF